MKKNDLINLVRKLRKNIIDAEIAILTNQDPELYIQRAGFELIELNKLLKKKIDGSIIRT